MIPDLKKEINCRGEGMNNELGERERERVRVKVRDRTKETETIKNTTKNIKIKTQTHVSTVSSHHPAEYSPKKLNFSQYPFIEMSYAKCWFSIRRLCPSEVLISNRWSLEVLTLSIILEWYSQTLGRDVAVVNASSISPRPIFLNGF